MPTKPQILICLSFGEEKITDYRLCMADGGKDGVIDKEDNPTAKPMLHDLALAWFLIPCARAACLTKAFGEVPTKQTRKASSTYRTRRL